MPDDFVVRAPGRVNLIGEHTDYSGGRVLPITLREGVTLRVRPARGAAFRFESAGLPGVAEFAYESDVGDIEPGWARYAWGALAALAEEGLETPPFEAFVDSDLPVGGGLASSAALVVATSLAALEATRRSGETVPEPLTAPFVLIQACRRAEDLGVGVGCGFMDPYASLLGVAGCALRIDCGALDAALVAIDPARFAFVIADSGVRHELADGGYETRRRECEEALLVLQMNGADAETLGEVTPAMLIGLSGALSPLEQRRVRHVVSENGRVDAAAEALASGDAETFGRLLDASHASLRDDFEVSCPEVDALVERARGLPGVAGARMTGGGFGGYVLVAVAPDRADEVVTQLGDVGARRVAPSAGAFFQ